MDDFNITIDPSCLQEAPLAIDIIEQLDVLGIILYSVLTLMAALSLLVYLEECVYIYRKVPSPKKTTIIWVTGAAPVIATMSCLGLWIPKAIMFTDMTSGSYFAIVVYKFLILMLEEWPCCCCCPCLPHAPVTRRTLFLLKFGSLQFALLKTIFTIISIVLWANGNFDLSDLEITGTAIWINPFVGVLTIIALWPVAIMFMHLRNTLRSQKLIPKYAMYQLVLVLSQLQTAIINILALNGDIACAPPFSSSVRGSLMSQQLLILEMFIITLVNRLLYRRHYEPLPAADQHEKDNAENATIILQCENGDNMA
ncbi:hypothetical protein SKAU_G00264400 [Synaphobranchus kaupii]|uniref:Organic solute transporter subunit alpha n=1 Tax=Synaphobranchus kaupii TaxID=118154 RepID=A0A9Q1IPY1_SYNKA|nr:hypothetical protein SKAU_G00264400 [Synaphobranchus kaupii]